MSAERDWPKREGRRAVNTKILGNDGVHEWGVTTYDDGSVVEWAENLAARDEFVHALAKARANDPKQ